MKSSFQDSKTPLKRLWYTFIIAMVCIGIGPTGCGGSRSSPNETIYSARGEYTYDTSGTFSFSITDSDFPDDCFPNLDTFEFDSRITKTMLILTNDADEIIWTRDTGAAGNPVGYWSWFLDRKFTVELDESKTIVISAKHTECRPPDYWSGKWEIFYSAFGFKLEQGPEKMNLIQTGSVLTGKYYQIAGATDITGRIQDDEISLTFFSLDSNTEISFTGMLNEEEDTASGKWKSTANTYGTWRGQRIGP